MAERGGVHVLMVPLNTIMPFSRCAQTLLRCGSSPDCVTITTAP